ncbi:hypothetical protein Tco_0061684, partial [Tanacetum coccineum]
VHWNVKEAWDSIVLSTGLMILMNLVAKQDAQIEAKVAVHFSNYEKAQMEWFKKLKLLLGRELQPPSGHQADMS